MKKRKRCAGCDGRFGLVRYHHHGKAFCSNTTRTRCKQRYIEEVAYRRRTEGFHAWLTSK